MSSLLIDELVKDDRVHRRLYTDPDIFEMEMQLIFEKTWVFIGHESEVAFPGDYKTVYIGRQPAIMNRNKDGEIVVMLNRCMHRGAQVCREEKGNTSTFQCIYHGWSYNNNGELIGVPYRKGYGDNFDVNQFALPRAPRVANYRGFIFASLSDEGMSLENHLGEAKHQLDLIVDASPVGEIEVRSGVQKYIIPANWKFQIENWIDGYHPNFTHQTAFEIVQRNGGRGGSREGSGAITVSYPNGHGVLDYTGIRLGRWFAMINRYPEYKEALIQNKGEERAKEIMERDTQALIFPNLFFQRDYQHFRIVRPISVDRTEIYAFPYTIKGVPDALNQELVTRLSWWASAGGFGQPDDVEAFVRCQDGLQVTGAEWVVFLRGLEREQQAADGKIQGDITDEVTQRGIYREWKRLMSPAVD